MVNQLGFIQIFVQELHHFIPHFHPDTNVHCAWGSLNADFLTFIFEPVGPLTPNSGHNLPGVINLSLVRADAHRPVAFHQDLFHHGVEFKLCSLLCKVMLELFINLIAFLGPQMADGAFHQL